MSSLRPFRNTDPPALVEVWRSQSPARGLTQVISVPILEHFVLAKPYFDRSGLVIAENDGNVIGFVHAAFGPNENRSDISRNDGVVCMLQITPEFDSDELRQELLDAAEEYVKGQGANKIIGGPSPPYIPFYHGLCGSGELPGVLADDRPLHETYQRAGYSSSEEFAVMDCQLANHRPFMDRTQRQLARIYEVRPTLDHVFDSWWETCAFGPIQRSQFDVVEKADNLPRGSMLWWDLEVTGERQGPGVALSRLNIADHHRRAGLATYLVSNALKQLRSSGATLAQVQVPLSNRPALEFFRKLEFKDVARGTTYEKQV